MSEHFIDKYVGKRVRLRRTILGMTQDVLGNAVGVTFQQIQKYEKGVNRISASRLFKIAKALNVPVQYFFGGLVDYEDYSDCQENSIPKYDEVKQRFYDEQSNNIAKMLINWYNSGGQKNDYEDTFILGNRDELDGLQVRITGVVVENAEEWDNKKEANMKDEKPQDVKNNGEIPEFGSNVKSISNATIKSVRLGFEDHGILDLMIFLDYGCASQGFGGYRLGTRDKPSGFLGYVMHGILTTLEVDTYDKLMGLPVRVYGNCNKIEKIGHFLKDKWFSFEECLEKYNKEV